MGDVSPDDNVRIIRRIFSAVDSGDFEALAPYLAPDVQWRPTGFLTAKQFYGGVEGVREWLADLAKLTAAGNTIRTFPEDYRAMGDRVLVLGRGRLERAVSPIEQELAWIWEFKDGKVVAMTNYLSHAEALEAAGVAPQGQSPES